MPIAVNIVKTECLLCANNIVERKKKVEKMMKNELETSPLSSLEWNIIVESLRERLHSERESRLKTNFLLDGNSTTLTHSSFSSSEPLTSIERLKTNSLREQTRDGRLF
jgi:hypothetical protein